VTRDTRRAILDAVLVLLAEGDGGFTYDRLAAKAGVSRQTLYTHFPERTALLIASVDLVRERLGADEASASVYRAATARGALDALIDFHLVYTPQIMAPSRAVEAQRAIDRKLSDAFERRPAGRRQLVRHVVSRLRAEGDLDDGWSVDDAADVLSALMTASFTSDLMEERGWDVDRLGCRLRQVIDRALLTPTAKQKGPTP
jgi:AcrR family transcriptional regulator